MRHRKSGRKLGRSSSHRGALWNNLVTSLLEHGRIETTVPKAKELRKYADRTIWWGVSVQGIVAKGDKASAVERARMLHARRMAAQTVKTDNALQRLFGESGVVPSSPDEPRQATTNAPADAMRTKAKRVRLRMQSPTRIRVPVNGVQ